MVKLRDYIDARDTAHDLRHEDDRVNLVLERTRLDVRLSDLNNLRREYIADRGQFVTRERYDVDRQARASEVDRSMEALQAQMNRRLEPLEKLGARAVLLFAGSAVFGGLVVYIVQKAIG